jgi:predicted dehydrogenase
MRGEINRRDFMKQAALSTAGASLAASGLPGGRSVAASDKIRVAVVGTGLEGSSVMAEFLKQPDVDVAAVCDVYKPHLERAVKATAGKAKGSIDFRQILDRQDIDAVLVATPDHWHALQTVLACQSGKDVYTEKPIATTIEEGRRMVEAARKYNRVVQVGTQWHSSAHFQKGVQLVQGGLIGKVTWVRTWNYLNMSPRVLAALTTARLPPIWTGKCGSAQRPKRLSTGIASGARNTCGQRSATSGTTLAVG